MHKALFNASTPLWACTREHYRTAYPNGGPAFQIYEDGSVGDGLHILARCASKRAAEQMFRDAGYRKVSYGWKA